MSAFEISRAAVDAEATDVDDPAEVVAQTDEYIIRTSGSEWISAEHPVEVEQ